MMDSGRPGAWMRRGCQGAHQAPDGLVKVQIRRGQSKVRFSKKNRAVQLMALAGIAAILVPTILAGFLMGWLWLFFLMTLIFVPLLFLDRRLDKS